MTFTWNQWMHDNGMLLSISRSSSASGPNFSPQGHWTTKSAHHFRTSAQASCCRNRPCACDSVWFKTHFLLKMLRIWHLSSLMTLRNRGNGIVVRLLALGLYMNLWSDFRGGGRVHGLPWFSPRSVNELRFAYE